ncbi:exosortase A [Acidiphilium acidophilum]|uniref:Exosortase n=1 Tax=Acidiphilium acidophilum TaxID=76588 RepID=A0AAW9DN47_ACIAO|nr:exosortase A [Acidiphilium acidophilum]MDX5930098.1 exosortase [Acidiphilium acidophilum]
MSVVTSRVPRIDIPARYRASLGVLGVALAVMGVLFHAEIVAAVQVWSASTAYNHCFLILPIAVWLAWDRRGRLRGLTPAPEALAILLAVPFAIGWLAADRLGIMEGRQLAAMGMVQALLLGVLGRRVYRAMAAPFLYLIFLVPFGGFLVPALQQFTTDFVDAGLRVLGIAYFTHGYTIEIAQGAFHIAEACAGLRFLIAAIAFSVLYALLIFRSTTRRLTFIAVAVTVPVIANGFRALGIVWLGHELGSAKAGATDHVLYGYIFFSIVLFILILLGLPFRQDGTRPGAGVAAVDEPAPAMRASLMPAVAIPGFALVIVGLAGMVSAQAAASAVRLPVAPAGCTALAGGARFPAGGRAVRFACADGVTATIALFPPRTDPKPLFDARRKLSLADTREAFINYVEIPHADPGLWTLVTTKHMNHTTLSALFVDGRGTNGNLRTRLRLAWADLFGHPSQPIAMVFEAAGPRATALPKLEAFVQGQTLGTAVLGRMAQ